MSTTSLLSLSSLLGQCPWDNLDKLPALHLPRRQMLLVGDETKNVSLYYHMFDNFQIQFGREEFCLVTGLKFGVEYCADYNDEDEPIPFRRRVFSSSLDGKRITGKNVKELIKSKSFYKLHDDHTVSLCCICILQLVLLGVGDRRVVPNWILRDANVRRWLPLYATEPTNEVDKKTYSIFGLIWAFKAWILEVFREGPNAYYTRHRRYPRVVAWSSNKKFYRHMLRDFLHGCVPAERLIQDEIEAGSGWWVSSRAYFDGRVSEAERIPRRLNRQNHYEDMRVGTGANKEPIIVDHHYGISDLSGFQSIQVGPSSFQTSANNSFFNMGTGKPQCHRSPNKLERPRREQRPSVYMQSPYTPLPPTTELPKKRIGKTKKKCKNNNLSSLNFGNAFAHDNVGGDDVVITGVHDTGIYFTYENVDLNKVTREEYNDFTEFILNPYDVYFDCHMMGYLVSNFLWRQLVLHLCMPRSHSVDNPYQEGWFSGD
nr:phospholipase-like protein [Tanacetum cinerariifolium]